MKKAVFPGSFDPFTLGHHSIVKRALSFMDEVIRRLYADEPRVKVEAYSGLTVDFAREQAAEFIIRGIRTVKDFEYEEGIADINRKLTGIETLFLFTEPELASVSSSVVRELLHYGKDVSMFLPEGMEL